MTLGSTELIPAQNGETIRFAAFDLTPHEKALVAALALRRGSAVTVSTLIEMVWGASQPPTADQALRNLVSHIRHKVGEQYIATVRGGYQLSAPLTEHDAQEFVDSIGLARAIARDQPEKADDLLEAALQLWRGEPYADLDDMHEVAAERRRLQLFKQLAAEDRAYFAVAHDPALALAGLEQLCTEAPSSERTWALLAGAQFLSQRQADALRTLALARHHLREEFGLSPGPVLRGLEQAVLGQDEVVVRTLLDLGALPAQPARVS